TPHGVEERENQVAIHEPVYALRTGALLERSQRISRAREEAAPSAQSHRVHCGCSTITLRGSGEVEDHLGPFAWLKRQAPDEPVGYSIAFRPIRFFHGSHRVALSADRKRH